MIRRPLGLLMAAAMLGAVPDDLPRETSEKEQQKPRPLTRSDNDRIAAAQDKRRRRALRRGLK